VLGTEAEEGVSEVGSDSKLVHIVIGIVRRWMSECNVMCFICVSPDVRQRFIADVTGDPQWNRLQVAGKRVRA